MQKDLTIGKKKKKKKLIKYMEFLTSEKRKTVGLFWLDRIFTWVYYINVTTGY